MKRRTDAALAAAPRAAMALGAAIGLTFGAVLGWPRERTTHEFAGGAMPLPSPYPPPYHPPYHNAFASGSLLHVLAVAVLVAYFAALLGVGLGFAYFKIANALNRHDFAELSEAL